MNSESNANGRCRSQFARHIDDKYMHEEIEHSWRRPNANCCCAERPLVMLAAAAGHIISY